MPAVGADHRIAEVQQRAVSVKLKSELRMIRTTCELYEADNGQYPDFASGRYTPFFMETRRRLKARTGNADR